MWHFVFGLELRNLLRSHGLDLLLALRDDGCAHIELKTPINDKIKVAWVNRMGIDGWGWDATGLCAFGFVIDSYLERRALRFL